MNCINQTQKRTHGKNVARTLNNLKENEDFMLKMKNIQIDYGNYYTS